MAEGLVEGLKELVARGRLLSVGRVTLMPRIILMTDGITKKLIKLISSGEPDSKEDVMAVAKACADIGFPIACVGVSGCDASLLRTIATMTGGMFFYANEITDLSVFFLKQILITIYITKFAEQLEQLYSREVLGNFFREQTGETLNAEELDMFILYLKALAVVKEREESNSTPSLPTPSAPIESPMESTPVPKHVISFLMWLPLIHFHIILLPILVFIAIKKDLPIFHSLPMSKKNQTMMCMILRRK